MSEGLLFAIGSVVFIFGALGLVLVGLDWVQTLQRRDAPADAPHLASKDRDHVRSRLPGGDTSSSATPDPRD